MHPLPGFFRYLRVLLNARVPSSLEPSTVPPTPMAAAIRDLVMNPLYFSSQSSSGEESAFTANDRQMIGKLYFPPMQFCNVFLSFLSPTGNYPASSN